MGLTQRAVLVIYKGRKIVKKNISVVHLCVISIIFLFLMILDAAAGRYIYYNEKGEEVSYGHKNAAQQTDTADTESVESSDTGKILSRRNKDEQDIDLPENSGAESDKQDADQEDKNQKDNKK